MHENKYAELVFRAFELIEDMAKEISPSECAVDEMLSRAFDIHADVHCVAVLKIINEASKNDWEDVLNLDPFARLFRKPTPPTPTQTL